MCTRHRRRPTANIKLKVKTLPRLVQRGESATLNLKRAYVHVFGAPVSGLGACSSLPLGLFMGEACFLTRFLARTVRAVIVEFDIRRAKQRTAAIVESAIRHSKQ